MGFWTSIIVILVHIEVDADALLHPPLRERDHWGDPDVDGRLILRWIFRK
jgi:hypothetical protein